MPESITSIPACTLRQTANPDCRGGQKDPAFAIPYHRLHAHFGGISS